MTTKYRIYEDGTVVHQDSFNEMAEDRGDFQLVEVPDALLDHICNQLNYDFCDATIQRLEARGLRWDIESLPRLYECRIWDWPTVIGRYRCASVEPLNTMLRRAVASIEGGLEKYPVKVVEASK